ncbi:hypothetical protein [Streptomyces abyssomicinicus]|uniref:hypothetical protein n=1 Tax=Streptomyces abyssomicinicus TaxID=574929 RepID=UPI00124FEE96|nr:hypothetical protein [Streptomyces abyssomicinicus]
MRALRGRRPRPAGKLTVIARGTTTALRGVRPWPFPASEDAITACLAPDPADRPTPKELTVAW